MGGGEANFDQNHIKVISEVQAFQPRPFNKLNHWSVAVKAGSVHLILSKDRKLGWKGGDRPHPQQHHPVPQGPSFSIKCLLATRSPPDAHKQSHKNHTASTKPKCTQLLHDRSTTLPTQELTSFPVRAEQQHLLTTIPTLHLRCLSSGPTVRTITLV